ncbi:hypothetical protein JCGZ_09225 [Jatropha curcas]|uniref:Protein BZR1 homolog n=2 Tax=Jatropha curcas TaxID=180498 RepID=A0A067KFN1_JATCU|nr:hypothetical protein JCGZ_09225 [Jatropha curcas]
MVGSSSTRSESEKEKTKLRERQRRAITTKIFHGLRRHGGYHLSPRADINEVLRELAKEAGWIVEPDGTTHRCKLLNRCPTCGATPFQNYTSTTTTPTSSSTVIVGGSGAGGVTGGECSTTTSPRQFDPTTMIVNSNNNNGELTTTTATSSPYICSDGASGCEVEIPLAFYMYRGIGGATVAGGGMKVAVPGHQQPQQQEARTSNQNTPVGSPLHHSSN